MLRRLPLHIHVDNAIEWCDERLIVLVEPKGLGEWRTVGKEFVFGDLIFLGEDDPELVRSDEHLLLQLKERCLTLLDLPRFVGERASAPKRMEAPISSGWPLPAGSAQWVP